ncbi:hypothetical protein OIU85_007973 [Salix viminalis]|uniref:Wall-associated receptor kinase galacturonan-binding domain-containing protein n=1 Tax=Salix viminalis TaxID=40686 RepID=A0A9Q0PAC2_SALVM|nr:hypothetical protein OIU85_007973 [Salix viminalis]
MNSSVFSFLSDFVFLLLLFIQIPSSLSNDDLFTACKKDFACGGIFLGFPFWGAGRPAECRIPELELKCNENKITTMNIDEVAYRVLKINREDEILRIDWVGLCPPQFMNRLQSSDFSSLLTVTNFVHLLTVARMLPQPYLVPKAFTCKEGENGPGELCNGSVIVPVSINQIFLQIGIWQLWKNG